MSNETIQITLLVMQRKGDYEGQFAPEVLAVVDEWTMEDNPDWWIGEVNRHKQSMEVGDEVEAWAEVCVDLPREAIEAALFPSHPPIVPTSVRAKSGDDHD